MYIFSRFLLLKVQEHFYIIVIVHLCLTLTLNLNVVRVFITPDLLVNVKVTALLGKFYVACLNNWCHITMNISVLILSTYH